jgi:hypothetical protein
MIEHKEKLEEIFGSSEVVSAIVISLCAAMFDNGIRLVHIGGLMRMLGISNEVAQEHDNDAIELPDNFYEELEQMEAEDDLHTNNRTIH